jgi:hypothetical protein
MVRPGVNPSDGRSFPRGGENLKAFPEGRGIVSVAGLNESFPENASAVTIVGEARKFLVSALPSFRDLKFLWID